MSPRWSRRMTARLSSRSYLDCKIIVARCPFETQRYAFFRKIVGRGERNGLPADLVTPFHSGVAELSGGCEGAARPADSRNFHRFFPVSYHGLSALLPGCRVATCPQLVFVSAKVNIFALRSTFCIFDFVLDTPSRHNQAGACFCARLFVSLTSS